MEDSVATTPSPVPQPAGPPAAAAAAAASAGSADAYPSPPRNQSQPATQQQQQPQQQQANAPVRILGRNVNGTVVQTSMPQNEAELQLYRVMQRASLLSYYDTLLEMGGDDVQQLCDAGEAEFLEIMALVGMASKPLHVRRLQKALQEWLTNPGMFQTPVMVPTASSVSGSSSSGKAPATPGIAPVAFPCIGSYSPNSRQQIQSSSLSTGMSANISAAALSSISSQSVGSKLHAGGSSSSMVAGLPVAAAATPPSVPCHSGSPAAAVQLLGQFSSASGCGPIQRRRSLSPQGSTLQTYAGMQMPAASSPAEPLPTSVAATGSVTSTLTTAVPLSHSPGIIQVGNYESSSCGSQGTTPSPNSNSAMITAPQSPTMGLQSTPILLESQVQRLAEAAERLAATLRPLNPKPQSGIKKKMCKNLEMVMAMPDSDPRRMEEIRKYAAIYGRFDCKRKPEKPLTLHEVSVNEAAAQICRFVPALLTRRDELFPLARRVVRDSGHYYTKGLLHSSNSCNTSPRTLGSRENGEGDLSGGDETVPVGGADASKRRKLELRCEDEQENSAESTQQQQQQQQQQAESARSKCSSYARGTLALDSDGNSIQIQQNRHRKRQRRRRPSKIHKSISSPVWQTCSDNSMVLEGVVEDLEDSDGCYSSFEDDWDDCNEDDCENNFEIDTDDGAGDDDAEEASVSASIMHDVQSRVNAEKDDVSCVIDKENDFNLKVIASCGDNIIAVANPALMNRNQPAAITKETPIKEEIPLRDRRD